MLQPSLGLVDVNNLLYLVAYLFNIVVHPDDYGLVYKDCVFLVRRDRGLGHSYQALQQADTKSKN